VCHVRSGHGRSRNEDTQRSGAQAWQLGIVTDRAGHVHLGAVVAGTGAGQRQYIDLLAPLGACSADELDLQRLTVLGCREQLDQLGRIADCYIDDARLRQQIVQFADLAEA